MHPLVLPHKEEIEAFREDVWGLKGKNHLSYITNVSYLVMQELEDTVPPMELITAQGRGSRVRH